jgi:Ca2+:H+ antiporter
VKRLGLVPLDLLLVLVPAALAAGHLWSDRPVITFALACLAIIPLAGLMGRATEALASHVGAAWGGFLSAAFGNAAELILALAALRAGELEVVKASLTGSIIGNLLLVLGLAILIGGLRHPRQVFNRTSASMGTTLLALACAGLVVPTLFFYLYRASPAQLSGPEARNVENLSEEIAVVLAAAYALSLLFSLRTHKHLFSGSEGEPGRPHVTGAPERRWGVGKALLVLAGATAGVALLSEWLVGAVEKAAEVLGMTPVFVGVIVVAVVGNAAEHSTAVWMAWKDRMDLAVQIAVGSSTQVALFVAPVLVFASLFMGHAHPLDLHFTPLEVVAVLVAVAVTALVSHDGESNWLEGALLLAVYVIFALAFYHLPAAGE